MKRILQHFGVNPPIIPWCAGLITWSRGPNPHISTAPLADHLAAGECPTAADPPDLLDPLPEWRDNVQIIARSHVPFMLSTATAPLCMELPPAVSEVQYSVLLDRWSLPKVSILLRSDFQPKAGQMKQRGRKSPGPQPLLLKLLQMCSVSSSVLSADC